MMIQTGENDAKEFFSMWERLTNRMGSEDMTPHLVEYLDREHPTLRQQMVAQMVTMLNTMDTSYCDARNEASNAFLVRFQEWLQGYENLYISSKGKVQFPFI